MGENITIVKKSRCKRGAGFFLIIFLFFCIAGIFIPGCNKKETVSRLKVVTTTSLIEEVVHRVGNEKVDVINIIPPAQCPGHFDVKPGDIRKLADADIFFLHGWQGEMFSNQLISSVENPELIVVILDVAGNWMVPSVHIEAAEKIKTVLIRADSENQYYYETQSAAYVDEINTKEKEVKARLETVDTAGVKVLCAEMQAGFIQWTGLSIVSAYGRPDSLTPGVVKELVDKGKSENVNLIIDNLQSGKDAGIGIAEELHCHRIILSNFPGGVEHTETWEKTMDYNIQLIVDALKK
jgi:zinc transport system substrate-binding protein